MLSSTIPTMLMLVAFIVIIPAVLTPTVRLTQTLISAICGAESSPQFDRVLV